MLSRTYKIFLLSALLVSCETTSTRKEAFTELYAFSLIEKENEGADDDLLNLTLEISCKDQSDLVDALSRKWNEEEVINYLSFRLNQDIKLVQSNDTLDMLLFHFERSYHLKKSRVFHLTFEKKGDFSDVPKKLLINSPLFDSQVAIPFYQPS